MTTPVYVVGVHPQLNSLTDRRCSFKKIENPLDLLNHSLEPEENLLVLAFLPYLDLRQWNAYLYLKKRFKFLKIFFILEELSERMTWQLRNQKDFYIFWSNEQLQLTTDILKCLKGEPLTCRQDSRTPSLQPILITKSLLLSNSDTSYSHSLKGHLKDISLNGTRLQIKKSPYQKKDFLNITYQNKEGDYKTFEAQVRWVEWNEQEQIHELGLQLVGQN